jgi:hypothetical protein
MVGQQPPNGSILREALKMALGGACAGAAAFMGRGVGQSTSFLLRPWYAAEDLLSLPHSPPANLPGLTLGIPLVPFANTLLLASLLTSLWLMHRMWAFGYSRYGLGGMLARSAASVGLCLALWAAIYTVGLAPALYELSRLRMISLPSLDYRTYLGIVAAITLLTEWLGPLSILLTTYGLSATDGHEAAPGIRFTAAVLPCIVLSTTFLVVLAPLSGTPFTGGLLLTLNLAVTCLPLFGALQNLTRGSPSA